MNQVYIPDELRLKLDRISEYSVTVFEAPTGYGKTAIIKNYLAEKGTDVTYLNIITESPELYYEDFIEALCACDTQGLSDRKQDCLEALTDLKAFRSLLRCIKSEKTKYIVIDNYQLIDTEDSDKLIDIFAAAEIENIKLIILSSNSYSTKIYQMILKNQILLFDKSDFEFSKSDIYLYFDLEGLHLLPEQVNYVYKCSEGWILAINIMLENYRTKGSLNSKGGFFRLVENILWDMLNTEERHALIAIVRLKEFTSAQAHLLTDHSKSIDFNKILDNNPFILYDDSARKYGVHYILRKYVDSEFDEYSLSDKQNILKNSANIFESMGNLFDAMKGYFEARDWERIVHLHMEMADVYPYVTSENKEFFLSLIKEFPPEHRMENYELMMLLCMVLFLYNDRENMMLLYNEIQNSIDENNNLSEKEKDIFFGRLSYTRGYIEFNDIEFMTDKYMNAINLLEGSTTGIVDKTPWNYGVPSILHLYHRTMGGLKDEVNNLSKCMPFYYRISNGHGKGAEAVFDAESLFITGDFKGAEILCHKAAYMADSRDQVSISLCALMILARMSVVEGNFDQYTKNFAGFESKVREGSMNKIVSKDMVDLCEGTIYMITGNMDKLADWLKDWESIENNTNIISRSYANVIYGKYLYMNEEYEKLLGISGQFLGIAAVFENIIPRIYTYIYIAMANKAIGEYEKAIRMLRVAFDFAVDDNIIMPFVENSTYIEEIYNNIAFDKEYRDFLRKIKQLAKDYNQGIKAINKNFKNRDNYGLTAREYDVAKLAAQRLTNKEIADHLFIAESTVKSNLKVVFNKLNINSRAELKSLF